jgi:hypothetical protein
MLKLKLKIPHPAFGHLLHSRGEGMLEQRPISETWELNVPFLLHESGEGAQRADEVV